MLVWDGYGLQSTHSGIGKHALELAVELERLGRPPTIIPSSSSLDPAFSRWRADFPSLPFSRVKPLALMAAGYQARALLSRSGDRGPAIFHGLSNYNIPNLSRSFQRVLTVHDLIPFLLPEGVSRSLHWFLRYQMPKAVDRAERIICVSEWTASSVRKQFPQVGEKIVIIPNGRSSQGLRLAKDPSLPVRLLSLSRGEVYKRLNMIPEIKKHLPETFEWHVVSDGRGCAQLGEVKGLTLHQNLSNEALEDLWRATDIFVHPSLWEGYCLPAATALSFQIPTVYTGGSGIDEVTAAAGLRLDASDSCEMWAEAILRLLDSREDYESRCSRQWESLPSWSKVAGQLSQLYDNMTL